MHMFDEVWRFKCVQRVPRFANSRREKYSHTYPLLSLLPFNWSSLLLSRPHSFCSHIHSLFLSLLRDYGHWNKLHRTDRSLGFVFAFGNLKFGTLDVLKRMGEYSMISRQFSNRFACVEQPPPPPPSAGLVVGRSRAPS